MIEGYIVKYSNLFDGVKEVGNNDGWEDIYFPELGMTFRDLMVSVGWRSGQAWCAYLSELIWKLAYQDVGHPIYNQLDDLFSASVMNTLYNFKRSDFVCSSVPEIGSLAIFNFYSKGKSTRKGHIGIVQPSKLCKYYVTLDGNTSSKDKREGDQVGKNTWELNRPFRPDGLNFMCFVHPKPINSYFI